MGFSDKDYLFINVASISPPKGQNVILAALKKITQEHPNIRVLLVGSVWDEAYLEFLKNRVEEFRLNDCVRFIGQVEDVRPYLRLADAFSVNLFRRGRAACCDGSDAKRFAGDCAPSGQCHSHVRRQWCRTAH